MGITNVIVHEVRRERDGDTPTSHLRVTANDPAGLTAKLTNDLIELFSTANLNIGEFGVGGNADLEPVFEQYLNKYYSGVDCSDFVELTRELAIRYQSIISEPNKSSVKGGYLVFYEYEYRSSRWLAIAIVQRTAGVDITEQLDVVAAKILDLNKLHLGATIDLTKWRSGSESRYIRFKTGLAAELREYFENFIGCQRDRLGAKVETKDLRKAIQDYGRAELDLSDEDIQARLDNAVAYIKSKSRQNLPILLSELGNTVFPEDPDKFLAHTSTNYTLSEELAIDTRELGRFAKLSGRGKGINISFDRELLESKVVYGADGSLRFTEIPLILEQEIKEELELRKQD